MIVPQRASSDALFEHFDALLPERVDHSRRQGNCRLARRRLQRYEYESLAFNALGLHPKIGDALIKVEIFPA